MDVHRPTRAGALALGAALVTTTLLPRPSLAQRSAAIRVGATANDTYAEAYYAHDLGLFKKASLNVDVATFTNGASVAQALAAGSLDIGISNIAQVATAVEHGIPFAFFAGGGLYSSNAPTTALCVAKSSTIASAKDFEGKTIAVSTLKDTSLLATQAWLTQNGADPANIKFVEIPFSGMGPALERGTVEGAVISEPSLTAARDGGAKIFGKSYDGIAKRFLISGWLTTADYAKNNGEALKKFTQAIYEAARWANAHHAESAAILVKYAKLEAHMAQHMTRCTYAESLDPREIQPTLDLAYKNKLIAKPIAAADLIVTPA